LCYVIMCSLHDEHETDAQGLVVAVCMCQLENR
jgi:hypothetical protein